MKVYLMRHGEAATMQGEAEPKLTLNGERQADDAARALMRRGASVEVIVHSGKRRARETAQIVASKLSPAKGTEAREGLGPNDDIFALVRQIEELDAPVLFVSHLPLLDQVAGLLVEENAGASVVGFSTGEIACLERGSRGVWRIAWTHRMKSG